MSESISISNWETSKFVTVSDPKTSALSIFNDWTDVKDFKGKGRIVDENGKKVSSDFTGQKYQLISKKERMYSTSERLCRVIAALVAIACTVFLALIFSKSIRDALFCTSKQVVRIGLLQSESNTQKVDKPKLPRTIDIQKPPIEDVKIEVIQDTQGDSACVQTTASKVATVVSESRVLADLPEMDKGLKSEQKSGQPVDVRGMPPSKPPASKLVEDEEDIKESDDELDEKPPVLPPTVKGFPVLINLRIKDESHPLKKSVALEHFLKKTCRNDYAESVRRSLEVGSPIEGILSPSAYNFSDWMSNENLLNFSLHQFIYGTISDFSKKTLIDHPDNKDAVQAINQRIEELDKEYRIKDRMKLIGDVGVRIRDILGRCDEFYNWTFNLAGDEELVTLTALQIGGFGDRILGFVPRLLALASQSKEEFDAVNFDVNNATAVNNIRLIDIAKLKADAINGKFSKFFQQFPMALNCISPSEMPLLEMKYLELIGLDKLFANKKFVHSLSKDKLYDCIPKVDVKLLVNLSHQQRKDLDFAKLDKKTFKGIFTKPPYSKGKGISILRALSPEEIVNISHLFSEKHGGMLRVAQIKAINFNNIKDKETFKVIVTDYSSGRKALQSFDSTKIHEICHLFSDEHWKMLTEKQIKDLDFSKIDKRIFGLIVTNYSYSEGKKALESFDSKKVNEICHLFTDDHWKMLKAEQIDLESTKIDKGIFGLIVTNYSYSEGKKALESFDGKKIHKISHLFTDAHWMLLKEEQIKGLDFTKIDKRIFGLIVTNSSYSEGKEALASFDSKKVNEICHLFTDAHWKMLNEEQIKGLDFTKIDKRIFGLIVTNSSYSEGKKALASFDSPKINEICHLFTEDHWKMLNEEQIKGLDFTKIDKRIFGLIVTNSSYSEGKKALASFDSKKIHKIRHLFSAEHRKMLNADQINALEAAEKVAAKK